jgi:hypothetical protein
MPARDATDEMLMIAPLPDAYSNGYAARQARIAAILVREQVRSQEELADLLER